MNNKKKRTRIIGAALACTYALSMTACTQQDEAQSSEELSIVSYDEINKEYQDSVAQLDWPDSYTPPANLEGSNQDTGTRALLCYLNAHGNKNGSTTTPQTQTKLIKQSSNSAKYLRWAT